MKISNSTCSLLLLPLLTLVPTPSFSPVTSDSPSSESKVTKDFSNIQTQTTTSTYENPDFGLRFQYPSNWTIYNYPPDEARGGNIIGAITTFKEDPTVSTTSYPRFALYVITLNDIVGVNGNQSITSVPTNITLIEYLKTYYNYDHYRLTFSAPIVSIITQERLDYTLINDNQTTIGNGYELGK